VSKIIKKIIKILLGFLLVIILLLISAYFTVKVPRVQNYLVDVVTKKFSGSLNANFEIESVHYSLFNRIILNDVYIEDKRGEELIKSKKITGYLRKLDLKNRKLFFKKVEMDSANIHLFNDTSGHINIKFLVDALKRKDTTKPRMHIKFRDLDIINSQFHYETNKPVQGNQQIDINHLNLDEFNLSVNHFNADSGKVNFEMNRLSFRDKSGFHVIDLTTDMFVGPEKMKMNDLILRTEHSYLNADSLVINHRGYSNLNDFVSKVKLNLAIKRSNIGFHDLAFFSQSFQNIPNHNIVLSGNINGRINNIRGDEVYLAMGKSTELLTDFSIDGLPDINQSFLYVDIENFQTVPQDIQIVNYFNPGNQQIQLPDNLNNLGLITYNGNFTGFIDDFVAYGSLKSNLGEISTDILIKPEKKKSLSINGKLKTKNFDIGGLLDDQKNIGKLSMDMQIKGTAYKDKSFETNTDGVINKLEFNGYNYQNIKLDGLLTQNKYNGILSIEDPNVDFTFRGGIDFSKEVPVFDFSAQLFKAKLEPLNFVKEDTTANLSLNLMSNFTGNSLDNASGIISISKGKITRNNKNLKVDNFEINASQQKNIHKIFLKSDYIDGSLIGKYRSTSVHQSLKNIFYSYLPVFIKKPSDTAKVKNKNNFDLNLKLKNTERLTETFLPSLKIEENTSLQLSYDGNLDDFSLKINSDQIKFKKYKLQKIYINSQSQDSIFSLVGRFKNLKTQSSGETSYFNNFTIKSLTGNNKSKLLINWDDITKNSSKGEIIALLNWDQSNNQKVRTSIFLLPGKITLNEKDWQFSQNKITIDSSSISFRKFRLHNESQLMEIEGKISENPKDTLNLNFADINLAYANLLLPSVLNIQGEINGEAQLANIYDKPTFKSDLIVDSLSLNNQVIGNTSINSKWDNYKKIVKLDVESEREKLKTLDIEGEYKPSNKTLAFDILFDKLRLNFLDPIVEGIFSNMRGNVSGFLKMTGTTNNPILNGNLEVRNSGFTIDYLNTRYHFTKSLKVNNNSLIFRNTEITDSEGNNALVNGVLSFKQFNNLSYDLNINANNLKSLNTTGSNNSTFYGEAFSSGFLKIQGETQTNVVNIDASVTTDENTMINLPLGGNSQTQRSKFIKFESNLKNKKKPEKTDEYKVDLSGINMNFDLNITPMAETRLIFNPELGDMIKARGRGNINMGINKEGDFRMFGEYTIEGGDYMFSLKNVINKKFEIQEGSQIIWNGKPKDADINVTAVYNLRTSLSELFLDTTEYYNKRIPIECKIQLTEKLVNPKINFDIELPTADESTRARVRGAISSKQELNKQFLSLLVLNSFMPAQQYISQQSDQYDIGTAGLAFSTSELLSNQLSHWLSQISNNWDIGVNYEPGDEISKDQVEVALSTQLLNDRLIINGNVGTGGKYARTSEFVGDFRVDWKLTKNGKIRLKFFNRSSDRLIYEETRYIQGAGLFYRQEFNSFKELISNSSKEKNNKKKE